MMEHIPTSLSLENSNFERSLGLRHSRHNSGRVEVDHKASPKQVGAVGDVSYLGGGPSNLFATYSLLSGQAFTIGGQTRV